jgi:hypothetical protein
LLIRKRFVILSLAALLAGVCCLPLLCRAADKPKEVWTDPNDPTIPAAFKFQGEYVTASKGSDQVGCQVIALSENAFQAVVYPGGLPGAGWDGENKILMDGTLEPEKVAFTPTKGDRKYLAQKPEEFSATAKFPPKGQKDYTGTISGETLTINTEDGKTFLLKKTVRKSPTLGAKPPEGADVLFDGSTTDLWDGGRIDKDTMLLNTDGHDIHTKKKYNNYSAHVEFYLPYRPDARGQGRGNSGFYQVDMYEVQILDSFGLEGENNECGGVYTKLKPKVNMCFAPLTWQTYDVDFTNATQGEDGKKAKNARITVKHNGVVILEDAEITGPTGGGRFNDKEGTTGPLQLQGHGNPLQFRNVWAVEKK